MYQKVDLWICEVEMRITFALCARRYSRPMLEPRVAHLGLMLKLSGGGQCVIGS